MRSKGKLAYFTLKLGDSQNTSRRSSLILPYQVSKTFYVHQGAQYKSVDLTTEFLGHKLGEFSHTRVVFVHKRKQKAKLKARAAKLAAKTKVQKSKTAKGKKN